MTAFSGMITERNALARSRNVRAAIRAMTSGTLP
jgi:hypothetical protein